MAEILGQHFGARADAEKLSVSAQFRPVVGGRCCGGAELVWCQAECISQLLERLGVVVLDDARFVKHDTSKPAAIQLVQAVIVDDVHAGAYIVGLAAVRDAHANLGAFGHRLRCYGQRRQNQHIPPGGQMNSIRPGQLHPALTQPGIGKDGCAATAQRPFHQHALMVKQAAFARLYIEARAGN